MEAKDSEKRDTKKSSWLKGSLVGDRQQISTELCCFITLAPFDNQTPGTKEDNDKTSHSVPQGVMGCHCVAVTRPTGFTADMHKDTHTLSETH